MKSEELFKRSLDLVPGGVHSPVRSFKGLGRTPIFMEKGAGAYITDVEDKSYIDFCMSFGPLILGHCHKKVAEDVKKAIGKGWSFGTCERYSLELAEHIIERIPYVEQIRFVNSGTEAVMTALRLARGVTGKSKIIKFNGCYHGHTDSMLIKAGSGLAQMSEASSKGVPESLANDTIVLELNDEQALIEVIEKHGNQIAAVIVEPLPANNGLLVQTDSFLVSLRKLTKNNDILLIFDEVISGFRVGMGGMAEKLSIRPDIITYGKIIGGGFPVGAIAASKEIMSHLAPLGGVYQAGTLSANPLAMVAGLSTLKELNDDLYFKIEQETSVIVEIFRKYFAQNESYSKLKVINYASLFWIYPSDSEEPIRSIDLIPNDLGKHFEGLFMDFLDKGIYLSPNAYEVGFVSSAHDSNIINDLREKLENGK